MSNNHSLYQVCQSAWLVRQQRENLSRLHQTEAALCCRKANILETTRFMDAYVPPDCYYEILVVDHPCCHSVPWL